MFLCQNSDPRRALLAFGWDNSRLCWTSYQLQSVWHLWLPPTKASRAPKSQGQPNMHFQMPLGSKHNRHYHFKTTVTSSSMSFKPSVLRTTYMTEIYISSQDFSRVLISFLSFQLHAFPSCPTVTSDLPKFEFFISLTKPQPVSLVSWPIQPPSTVN